MATPGPSSGKASKKLPSTERLPSLKGKRDLTLGGVKKKVYTPTIPVRRPKPEPIQTLQPAATPTQTTPTPPTKNKTTKNDKKKGGKRQNDVIVSASVFSMGPADASSSRRGGDSGRHVTFGSLRGSGNSKDRKDLTKKSRGIESHDTMSSGEENEEETDGTERKLFPGSLFPPVQLPLMTEEMYKRPHPLNELHNKEEEEVNPLGVNIKEEPMEYDDDTAIKPVKPVRPVKPVVKLEETTSELSAYDLFQPSEDAKGQFLFFQIPDCLPIQQPTTTTTDTSMETEQEVTTPTNYSSLRNVPEGNIGQLRVHQSGKVTLSLGGVILDVSMATRGGFLQELVSLDHTSSSLSVLGHISHKLHCVPDFNSLGLQ